MSEAIEQKTRRRFACLVLYASALFAADTAAQARVTQPTAPNTTRQATAAELRHAEASLRRRLGVSLPIAYGTMVSLASPFDTLVAQLPARVAGRLACSEIAHVPATRCEGDPSTISLLVVPVDPTLWPNLFDVRTIGQDVTGGPSGDIHTVDMDGDGQRELVLTVAAEEATSYPTDDDDGADDASRTPDRVDPRGEFLLVLATGHTPRVLVSSDVASCRSSDEGEFCRRFALTIADRDRDGRPEIRIDYDDARTATWVFAYDVARGRIVRAREAAP